MVSFLWVKKHTEYFEVWIKNSWIQLQMSTTVTRLSLLQEALGRSQVSNKQVLLICRPPPPPPTLSPNLANVISEWKYKLKTPRTIASSTGAEIQLISNLIIMGPRGQWVWSNRTTRKGFNHKIAYIHNYRTIVLYISTFLCALQKSVSPSAKLLFSVKV